MTAQFAIGLAASAGFLIATAMLGDRVVTRASDPKRVTVVYWEKWTGSEGEEMRKVVNAFNASQDRIFVQYLSISGVDSKTMLATAGGNPPDVAGVWQEQVCQFADAHALTDLYPMALAAGLGPNYYIPGYWNPLFYKGGLWALPSTPASTALHVNIDLVPPDVASPETFPKTIEGLDALVDRITTKNADGSIDVAGFLPSDPGWWNWAWGYFYGGKVVDENGPTVNTPENVRAFEWIARYVKRFGSKQIQNFQSGFGNFASPQDPLMSGKVATEWNGVWKANYIRVYNPKLRWFAVPFPYPEDRPDLAGHSSLSQDVLAIPRGAKHPKEAFEFIRFVQRQDVMEGLCAAHGKNSPLEKVSEHFLDTHQNKFIRLFDQLARSPKAFTTPNIGICNQIRSEMDVAFQEVNSAQKSPKEALDAAQARLLSDWATYKEQVLNP